MVKKKETKKVQEPGLTNLDEKMLIDEGLFDGKITGVTDLVDNGCLVETETSVYALTETETKFLRVVARLSLCTNVIRAMPLPDGRQLFQGKAKDGRKLYTWGKK